MNGLWAVVSRNQASGVLDFDATLFRDRDDAVDYAAGLASETAAVGRAERHYVAEVSGLVRVDADGTEKEE